MMESNDQVPDDAPPSSLPEDLAVSIEGFPSEEAALAMGHGMLTAVRILGRYIDVSTLDGITVAADYDAALRGLDRGIEGLPPEERTNDEGLVGVGKAVLVKRGDEVKTHLVFEAGPVCCLAQEKPEESDLGLAIALIAHECAHVEEHARRERQFPGTLLNKKIEGVVPALLQQFSESFWCEYAACRAAAPFGSDQGGRYRETLSGRLERAREKARDAIRAYRSHHDQRRVFQEVAYAVLEPLRMASYLFGHLDGMLDDELPNVAVELPTADEVFVRGIARLVTQLRDLWDRRDRWETQGDIWILGETAFDVVRECGVSVRPREDGGAHIDVPYTYDTLAGGPNLTELVAIALRGRT